MRRVGHAVHADSGPAVVHEPGDLGHRMNRAEDVRRVREGHELRARRHQPREVVEIERRDIGFNSQKRVTTPCASRPTHGPMLDSWSARRHDDFVAGRELVAMARASSCTQQRRGRAHHDFFRPARR